MLSSAAFLAVVVLFTFYFLNKKRYRAKLPPGPPRLPIIGNLHQAPKEAVWVTFQKWVEQYGPIVAVDFFGTNVVILGDTESARDLLDKRANIYSSRPRMVMAGDLTTKGKQILFKPFGEDLFLHQRLEAPALSPRASACYTPIQDLESKQLLKNLLDSKNASDYYKLAGRFAASMAYSMTFGMRITTGEEWQLKMSEECTLNFNEAGQVGAWIVDALPFLNFLPAPLAPWKKTAEMWYQKWGNLFMTNMHDALQRDGWNWAKDFHNSKEAKEMTEMDVAWDVGVLCDAGIETTSHHMQNFGLACIAYPEWIPKAQEELDRVVGMDRLPDFDDLEKLPYIRAVVEESFRWRHVTPAGVPHATTKDDYYKGYLIPKGSTVVSLFNGMRHDKKVFDSPEVFSPDRWVGTGKSLSGSFGYGRRICPGRHIARRSLTIAMARLLWAFDIRSGDSDRPVVTEDIFTTNFVSGPKPFQMFFEPRSEKHRMVLEQAYDDVDKDVGRLMDQVREKQLSVGLKPRA